MYIKSLVLKISNIEKFISRWIFRLGRKTLPDEIFSAPKDFILGLLNGYFNNVGELFLSQELTIGISTLCSIAGIAINLKGGDICFRENQEIKVENDIWLDPVVSIEKIDGAKHKYVYDLTVPSTTNFAISNGLVVVDTADKPLQVRALQQEFATGDCLVGYEYTYEGKQCNIHLVTVYNRLVVCSF